MPERDYSHRRVVDKFGIKAGHAVALVSDGFELDQQLCEDIRTRTGRDDANQDERCDVVLISVDGAANAHHALTTWRSRIQPHGGIWLLTAKRGLPDYVNQNDLIRIGSECGLVDNKICSVSNTISGMRFVVRLADRSSG